MSFGIPVRNGLGLGLRASTTLSTGPSALRAALSLNFLSGALDSRITFSRGSQATLVDSTGKLTYAPNNLVFQSQDFDNAAWTKINSTVTADTAVAPDGTTTMDTLTTSSVTGRVQSSSAITVAASATYVTSVYVKEGTSTRFRMSVFDGPVSVQIATVVVNWVSGVPTFDTSGGSFVAGSFAATPAPNGTYRCSFAFTSGANTTAKVLFYPDSASGTGTLIAWGAQLEAVTYQTTPSTYTATTASAYYGPRFDYDPVTLATKGLLIEEQRTNLLIYSEQFDNAAWVPTGFTTTPNAAVAPNGTTTADAVTTGGTAPNFSYTIQTATSSTGVMTMYAKADTARYLVLVRGSYASGDVAIYDLQAGTVTQTPTYAGSTASIVAGPNGYYRCALLSAQATALNAMSVSGAGTGLTTGTAGQIYVWGAQLEAGAFATSYIPTVASTVTRSADVATMTGTNFSSWYNQSQGTFVFSGDSFYSSGASAQLYSADDGTANNRVWSFAAIGGAATGRVTTAGSLVYDQGVGSVSANTAFTTATAYALNDANTSTNGAVGTTDTTVAIPTVSTLRLGANVGGVYINGHIRAITYYNSRLTNTQLQALTT